jgi:hypothetical protein
MVCSSNETGKSLAGVPAEKSAMLGGAREAGANPQEKLPRLRRRSATAPQQTVEPLPGVCYDIRVSPTVFRYRKYRFYFFSREEPRLHVHVISPEGEAKFWLEPKIELATNKGLKTTELVEVQRIVEERQNEIREHWRRHFQS